MAIWPELYYEKLKAQDLPEGVLRSGWSLDGKRITLEYSKEKGYHINNAFSRSPSVPTLNRRTSSLRL